MLPRSINHKFLLAFGLVYLASFSWIRTEALKLPEAEDLELPQVQELELPQVEKFDTSKVEELELLKAEKIDASEAEELIPSKVEEFESSKVEELKPSKAEELKPSEVEKLKSSMEEELKTSREEKSKSSKEEELESSKKEELKPSKVKQPEYVEADFCEPEMCLAPNCRCAGLDSLSDEFEGLEKKIPQFITVTFDDGVNYMNYAQYEELLSGLRNPDNCSVQTTFFVTHEYTDYSKVHALYKKGHEIALHSVTHKTNMNYWREADEDLMMSEFEDQIKMLEAFAYVDRKNIRGMRLPFLQMSGNTSPIVGKKLGLLYDSSWPTQRYKNPPMWPYTLDYLSVQDCPIPPCPTASIPGFWISPMVTFDDLKGNSCSMMDACGYIPEDDEDEIANWMMDNFKRHYQTNRAPFGMYLHAAMFNRNDKYIKGFRKFLEHVTSLDDVYMTTMSQVIQFMQHPHLGKPFKSCPKKPITKKCIPNTCILERVSDSQTRYMTICGKCPEVYPWLHNPLGKRNATDVEEKNTRKIKK